MDMKLSVRIRAPNMPITRILYWKQNGLCLEEPDYTATCMVSVNNAGAVQTHGKEPKPW